MKKRTSRKIDPLGRIILPAEFRLQIGIEKNDDVDIVCEEDCIVIRKAVPNANIIPLVRD